MIAGDIFTSKKSYAVIFHDFMLLVHCIKSLQWASISEWIEFAIYIC